MPVIEIRHPLVKHKIGLLREDPISTKKFRELTAEIGRLLAYEACKDFPLERTMVQGWNGPVEIEQIKGKKVTLVPILRAGLGMLDGMMRLLPTAEVGFLGMIRDEETLIVSTYADRVPHDLSGRQVYVLDPMLATGGTLVDAIDLLLQRGATDVTAICLLAAPEGLQRLRDAYDERDVSVQVVTAGCDERLNEKGYIVPGLGDAGDRLYGVVG